MEWQPIETAPKDGTKMAAVLDWQDDGRREYAIIWWTGDLRFPWRGYADGSDGFAEWVPSLWVPLPPVPDRKGEAA